MVTKKTTKKTATKKKAEDVNNKVKSSAKKATATAKSIVNKKLKKEIKTTTKTKKVVKAIDGHQVVTVKKSSSVKKDISHDDKVILTKDGLQKLEEELEDLKSVRRKEVAARLQEAISYGDLSENSEYEEAKNEQAFCEGRIVELEKMIKNAEIIDDKKVHSSTSVGIGTTVIIKDLEKDGEKMTFTIVGSTEANPFEFRISNESPVGKELIGKQKGEKIVVDAPGGVYKYQVMEVK